MMIQWNCLCNFVLHLTSEAWYRRAEYDCDVNCLLDFAAAEGLQILYQRLLWPGEVAVTAMSHLYAH